MKEIYMICEEQQGRLNKYPELFYSKKEAKKFIRETYKSDFKTNKKDFEKVDNNIIYYNNHVEPYHIYIVKREIRDE